MRRNTGERAANGVQGAQAVRGFELLGDALRRGATVLTATRRLARTLQQAYGAAQCSAGIHAWPTPAIHTFQGWLEQLWHQWHDVALLAGESASPPRLLNAAEDRRLWENVVRSAAGADPLLRLSDAAGSAGEAWRIGCQWQVGPAHWSGPVSEDCRWFAARAADFQRRLQQAHWVDAATLPDTMRGVLERSPAALELPASIIVVGFDVLPPQYLALLDAFAASGCPWEARGSLYPLAQHLAPATVCAYPTVDAELEAAARWARALLEAGSVQRIGIVVPDLQTQRQRVERIFADVLEPALLLAPHTLPTRFNVSLAPPLIQYPPINAALQLLELSRRSLNLTDVSGLLCSPYLIAAQQEMSARARFDLWLRRAGELELRLDDLLRWMIEWENRFETVTELRGRLGEFARQAQALNGQRTLRQWCQVIHGLLDGVGWPGQRSADSAEQQLLAAWASLLDEWVHLESVLGQCCFDEALDTLRRLAQETLFQPESPDAPVQIMGEREAAGLWFDALWVTGNHDEALPAAPRPHPFLPSTLQRRAGVPLSSAESALAAGGRWLETLRQCATQIVFSYPRQDQDRELHASPLLAPMTAVQPGALPCWEGVDVCSTLHRSRAGETWIDDSGPPLADGAALSLGTAVFKHQAACPFRAFAEVRLAAVTPPAPQFGLASSERGTLLHRALERIWKELGSHQALCALSSDELEARVKRASAAAVADLAHRRPSTLTPTFAAMEIQRLTTLLLRWLELEKTRAPFDVIQTEQLTFIEIGGLRVQGRVDRIDKLVDGGYVVIDYKTGTPPKLDHWFGRRPDDPQLPLYGLALGDEVTALTFAQVTVRSLGFNGYADREGVAPGVRVFADSIHGSAAGRDWAKQWEEWRQDLQRLAAAIRAGDATTDPVDGEKTCTHCNLQPLCRIAERAQNVALPEASDE